MSTPSKLTSFIAAAAALARPAKPALVEAPAADKLRREFARRLDDLPAHRRGHIQQVAGVEPGAVFAIGNREFDKVGFETFAALCPFVFEGSVLRPDWTLGVDPGGSRGNLNVPEPEKPKGPTRAERALAKREEARQVRHLARVEHGSRIKSRVFNNDIADADLAVAMRRADKLDDEAAAIMRDAAS